MRILAGDIGGTKTDLALFSTEAGPRAPLVVREFPSANYASLEVMAREFLAHCELDADHACFDVAGPVVDGRADLTNLPWILEEGALAEALGLKSVRLLNDLEAIAAAVPYLQPDDLQTLSAGAPEAGGALAVVAPGTGLGEAFLTWDGSRYRACASEGGHADFAPADRAQLELLRHLQSEFDHVSWERVCSGIGIPNLYDFLKASGAAAESAAVAERFATARDRTRVIVAGAMAQEPPCPLCRATVDLFVRILGAEAGNMALKVLATGGVFLGGGIPPRVLPRLQQPAFLEAFRAKGRLRDFMAKVPVHVIKAQAALIGAAISGMEAAGR